MLSFLSCVAATLAAASSVPLSDVNAASYFNAHYNSVDFYPVFNGYSNRIPVGTALGEVTKSSPVLRVRVSSPYVKRAPNYPTEGVDRTPLFAQPSESAAFASSYILGPIEPAAYVQSDSPLISGVRLRTPPSIGAQGVEYAPDEHKPYDPAVHLNEPAKIISPKYHALSGVIASVGSVSLINKNDPRKFGYARKA